MRGRPRRACYGRGRLRLRRITRRQEDLRHARLERREDQTRWRRRREAPAVVPAGCLGRGTRAPAQAGGGSGPGVQAI
ncbi:hypothetical protein G6F64_015560 [Rhizopus arrhizus]|uniref:Uncharacterized protein n=1 Tax=Rhizopus oryzae TaxID=64495 RepID=A0A9P7BHX8_RHIOR|nr:hypothetical protein G6F64_015560 [Rhizopus arrhizus]